MQVLLVPVLLACGVAALCDEPARAAPLGP